MKNFFKNYLLVLVGLSGFGLTIHAEPMEVFDNRFITDNGKGIPRDYWFESMPIRDLSDRIESFHIRFRTLSEKQITSLVALLESKGLTNDQAKSYIPVRKSVFFGKTLAYNEVDPTNVVWRNSGLDTSLFYIDSNQIQKTLRLLENVYLNEPVSKKEVGALLEISNSLEASAESWEKIVERYKTKKTPLMAAISNAKKIRDKTARENAVAKANQDWDRMVSSIKKDLMNTIQTAETSCSLSFSKLSSRKRN